jgi:hypothetical protein
MNIKRIGIDSEGLQLPIWKVLGWRASRSGFGRLLPNRL